MGHNRGHVSTGVMGHKVFIPSYGPVDSDGKPKDGLDTVLSTSTYFIEQEVNDIVLEK